MVGKDSVSAHHGKSSARSLASVKVPSNSGLASKPKEGTVSKPAGVAKTGTSVVAKADLRNKPRKSPGSSTGTSEAPAALPTLLCVDCKAASMPAPKGTICFMGNNGRASAFPAQIAGYVCKSPKCPNFDNPVVVAPPSEPKKYLVSKRHLLKAQLNPKVRTKPNNKGIVNDKTMITADDESDGKSDKSQGSVTATATMTPMDNRRRVNGLPNKDGTNEESMKMESAKMVSAKMDRKSDKSQAPEIRATTTMNNRKRVNGLLDKDRTTEESMEMELMKTDSMKMESTELDSKSNKSQGFENTTAMNDRRRVNGLQNEYGKMEMESTKTESMEMVKLQKQGNIEAKREAVLNNAIEGSVQKLAPSRENRVKVLVEAFESIISNHDGDDETTTQEPGNHNHRLRHLARGTTIECHGTSHHNVATRC